MLKRLSSDIATEFEKGSWRFGKGENVLAGLGGDLKMKIEKEEGGKEEREIWVMCYKLAGIEVDLPRTSICVASSISAFLNEIEATFIFNYFMIWK